MPSKGKKQSKIPSRMSSTDRNSSPLTPSSTLDYETNDEDLISILEEASMKYPSLIGKSAFIGRITDIDHNNSIGCKIWLSESSMVASSFTPGSIVSVSSPSNNKFSHSFPLISLANKFANHYRSDLGDQLTDEAGNYFALATILPSSKVAKNGIRLSSSLSNTMGNPSLGGVVFIYPTQSQIVPVFVAKDENPCRTKVNPLLVHECNDLFLELVHSENMLARNSITAKNSCETSYDHIGNGVVGTPKTPRNHLKLSSSNIKQLCSPACEDSTMQLDNSNGFSVDSYDIAEFLGDENVRKVIETGASTWLFSRCLLRGNFVIIPVLSQLCSFQVVGTRMLLNKVNYDITNRSDDLLDEASDSVEYSNDAFIVRRETKLCLCLPSKLAPKTLERPSITMNFEPMDIKADVGDSMSNLGGLSKEYAILKDIIVSSSANILSSLGLRTTKGVLLHGPPGTGKTSLALLCIRDAGVNLFSVNGPEIVGQYYGESEQALHEVFESARQAAPAVVFIDELDAIAPARKDGGEELSQRMVATLLNLMDGVSRSEGILVIAATNRPDSIEAALRRPGRLDREIEIGVPSPKQRLDILLSLLCEMEHSLSDIHVQNLAIATHGFVGADLATLCNEAALVCLRRYANLGRTCNNVHGTSIQHDDSDNVVESDSFKDPRDISRDYSDSGSKFISNLAVSSQCPPSSADDNIHDVGDGIKEACMLKVAFEDFEKAKMKVRPSAMREVILELPKVQWEDVGGQGEVKSQLMEAVEWPQKHKDAFKRIGIHPPSGILMFGPPGCSKTLMARAVASEAGLNFLAVKGPELFSKWVGESEKAVKSLFAKARVNAPSIIFFDEIDGLAGVRGKDNEGVSVSDRVMSQLLIELDGLHQRLDVTVIAATNRPDKIDSALLRPGRFDRLLYVGLPNENDREEIFHIHLRKIPCCSDVSFKDLAFLTEGFTGADISFICREAALKAMEENLHASEIRMQHLKASIIQVQPTGIHSYQELSEEFQRLVLSHGEEEKVGYNEHSSKSNWVPMRSLIKSIALFVRRLPEVLSISRPSSG
ncbi:calmodulin-interacting protein 111 [Humulus lupulus]|uniref:calmodulin-interacting protein 111 n=1 Tax=Humulus lupulus TaxID=3486 RepID=UPI002B402C3C|nr:calmodulin-interacting protein 111 [Humulus lupulus]